MSMQYLLCACICDTLRITLSTQSTNCYKFQMMWHFIRNSYVPFLPMSNSSDSQTVHGLWFYDFTYMLTWEETQVQVSCHVHKLGMSESIVHYFSSCTAQKKKSSISPDSTNCMCIPCVLATTMDRLSFLSFSFNLACKLLGARTVISFPCEVSYISKAPYE